MQKVLLDCAEEVDRKASDLDALMAQLLVLITHHNLNQCPAMLSEIVSQLHVLCRHEEIEYYPKQRSVLLKMQHLWQTRWFEQRAEVNLH